MHVLKRNSGYRWGCMCIYATYFSDVVIHRKDQHFLLSHPNEKEKKKSKNKQVSDDGYTPSQETKPNWKNSSVYYKHKALNLKIPACKTSGCGTALRDIILLKQNNVN